jgi:hypothetical protein
LLRPKLFSSNWSWRKRHTVIGKNFDRGDSKILLLRKLVVAKLSVDERLDGFSKIDPLRAKGSRLRRISWVAQLLPFVSSIAFIVVLKELPGSVGFGDIFRAQPGAGEHRNQQTKRRRFRQNHWLAAS